MKQSLSLFLPLVLTLIALQGSRPEKHIAPELLFNTDSILELTVETDLVALVNDIAYERDYHRAVISYLNDYGFDEMIPLKIKTRGNFRRGRDNCNFPPFLLNFTKKGTVGTIFEGRNKLKLVTHCVTEEEIYQNYILREFLVYRLLNQITEYSFKVRLVKIFYLDSEDVMESMTRFGFIIEGNKSLGRRISAKPTKVIITTRENPDYYLSTLLSLFQLMVGNTDWYLPDHNLQPFALQDESDTIAIPYDFDLTGFVNPHYSNQYRNYQLASPRDRYYLGFCRTEAEVEPVLDLLRDKRDALIKVVKDFKFLDQERKEDCIGYLTEFYDLIQSTDSALERMTATCGDEF